MLVPDGPLQSLPFSVLVTEPPEGRIADLKELRHVPWLASKYTFTTLPSVSSLRALRRFAKGSPADKSLSGFGDPMLRDDAGKARSLQVAGLFSRGPVADVSAVRQLPRLPETAGELKAFLSQGHSLCLLRY